MGWSFFIQEGVRCKYIKQPGAFSDVENKSGVNVHWKQDLWVGRGIVGEEQGEEREIQIML